MLNSSKSLVSVCIPTYNAAATIHEMLTSVIAQTYTHLEIIIVDNASTDKTLAIVNTFKDPRIITHRNASNLGGEGNFKRCVELATGKYTAIYHADDVYEPEIVKRQVDILESRPEVGAVFTEAHLIDEAGKLFGKIKFPKGLGSPEGLCEFMPLFKAILKHANFLICPSAMVRTAIYQKEIISFRSELFKSSADLDVWLQIAERHKLALLPAPLMRYRISKSQFSFQIRQRKERADFFLVTDAYLAKPSVHSQLDPQDFRNLERLERRDKISRAVNCFIAGEPTRAGKLLHGILTRDALQSALSDKRGLVVLLSVIYVRTLLLLKLNWFGQSTLSFLKRNLRK